MLNVIKDIDTKELIEYLERKDLKLDKDNIKIFCKEKVADYDFLKLIKEKLKHYTLAYHKLPDFFTIYRIYI